MERKHLAQCLMLLGSKITNPWSERRKASIDCGYCIRYTLCYYDGFISTDYGVGTWLLLGGASLWYAVVFVVPLALFAIALALPTG